jgi:hypothetical protein
LIPLILINPTNGESGVITRLNLSITVLYPSPPSINIFGVFGCTLISVSSIPQPTILTKSDLVFYKYIIGEVKFPSQNINVSTLSVIYLPN